MAKAEVAPQGTSVAAAQETERILYARKQLRLRKELLKSRGAKSPTRSADTVMLCEGTSKNNADCVTLGRPLEHLSSYTQI